MQAVAARLCRRANELPSRKWLRQFSSAGGLAQPQSPASDSLQEDVEEAGKKDRLHDALQKQAQEMKTAGTYKSESWILFLVAGRPGFSFMEFHVIGTWRMC
jgi:hypothetical protein